MKKLVVIGANGMLGYAVSRYFGSQGYQVEALSRREFDIYRDPIERLAEAIRGRDIVINCAGVIKQRISDYSVEEVLKVNAIFPVNLARLCDRLGILCFHVTTDCVYSGKKGQYSESDFFDADDVYGMSKNAGDTNGCMTLRTSIIGEEKEHFKSLLSWVKSQRGQTVNGYADHLWNGVTTVCLAEVIGKIIDQGLHEKGIFHIHTKQTLSKFDITSLINDVYGLGITVKKFHTGAPCDRSLKSEGPLSDRLVTKDLRTQLVEMRRFFEERDPS